ncbi:MAG: PA14 domain-containing protein [Phycisphaerae bacterium]|jgi:hypothetical protein
MSRLLCALIIGLLSWPAVADTLRIKNLKVLCVIYRGDPAGAEHMDDQAVQQAINGLKFGRMFYFRNSRAQLNCEQEFVVFDEAVPETAGPTYDHIVAHLHAHGVTDGGWDGLITTGVGLKGNFGGFTELGGAGACFGIHGVRGGLTWYPEDDPDVAYGTAWIWVHEFQHALDLSICERSGRKDMLHAHPYVDRNEPFFKGGYHAGEHFDWCALTLREFEGYMDIKGATNSFLECVDADGDGMPDDDPRLPMDEKRFGSDPTKVDTDGDGLSDLDEFLADRYRGSDPDNPDTDGDGVRDGDDPAPTVAIAPTMAYGEEIADDAAPLLQGAYVRNDAGGDVAVYASWTENGLRLRFDGPRPFKVLAKIDGSAGNGFWEGGDTYLLAMSDEGVQFNGLGLSGPVEGATVPFKSKWNIKIEADEDKVAEVARRVRDHAEEAGIPPYSFEVALPAALGQGVSGEINHGGPRAPTNVANGLTLVAGREVSFNIICEFEDGTRACLTPHHTMFATKLVKPADAPEAVLLRGVTETKAAIPVLDILAVKNDSRVDVVTDDGRVVGRRIGPGSVQLVGLDQDGAYTLTARTEAAESTPHTLLVDRTAQPPKLAVAGEALDAECEPRAEFELWWGFEGTPVAPIGGGQADEQGQVSLPLRGALTGGWVVTGYRGSAFEEPLFIESWEKIDRQFEGGPADPRLPPDEFSYRFDGLLPVEVAGPYTFELTSDDGSRLYIDDELVVDHWGHHGLEPRTATVKLDAGLHRVHIDYYELDGWAGIRLRAAGPDGVLTYDLPVRRLPRGIGEIQLFGVQTDRFGNRSTFGSLPSRFAPGKEQ